MRPILRALPIAAVALFAFSGVSVASDARIEALAIQQDYLEDYFLFNNYPTVAARYQNLAVVSLGSRNVNTGTFGNDRSVGVIGAGDNTSYGAFAIFLNQVQYGPIEQAQVDLTWAKQFSSVAIGLGVVWQSSSIDQTNTGGNEVSPFLVPLPPMDVGTTNVLRLKGGAKFDVGDDGMLELAGELGWLSWEAKDDAGTVLTEDDGNLSYRFSGRLFTEISNRSTLVPVVNYSRADFSESGDAENSYRSDFNLGVALHHEVNGNDLLILGVAANHSRMQVESTGAPGTFVFDSQWDLPAIFAALEFDVYNWLTARAGASKSIANRTEGVEGDDSLDVDFLESSFQFGLGMGLHFDHFDVDATINPNAVFTGGYLFSGQSSVPMGRITATYYF